MKDRHFMQRRAPGAYSSEKRHEKRRKNKINTNVRS
jgi:hypothetical protein